MNLQELRAQTLAFEGEFVQLILNRLGIIVGHQNTDLVNSILKACQKFQCTPKEYFNRLSNCADNSPLLEHLVADITVGETYFFRDKQQMHLLQMVLLPRIIKAKREDSSLTLRIWSAAVSSGEEIYTIAILLKEMLKDLHRWSIHLLGTDINMVALKKAKTGVYSKWSMRSTPDYFKNLYFTEKDNQFYLSSKIVDMVDFQYLNLNDNTYPSILNGTNSQDLIICRNVLIYFAKDSIERVMKKISSSLVEGGTLLLGASDPINIKGTNLEFNHNEGMVFSNQQAPEKSIPPLPQTAKILPKKSSAAIRKSVSQLDLLRLLDKGSWQEALALVSTEDTSTIPVSFLLGAKAKALANLGKLNEAVQFCEESLLLDSTNKDNYFTYALVLIELDRLTEAEAALRKVLFLDHKFVEAHFQLGLLLIKNKKIEAGLKSFHNALGIVISQDASLKVEGFKELNYGRFAEIIKSEIQLVAGSAHDG